MLKLELKSQCDCQFCGNKNKKLYKKSSSSFLVIKFIFTAPLELKDMEAKDMKPYSGD